jgi:hypothetical protein
MLALRPSTGSHLEALFAGPVHPLSFEEMIAAIPEPKSTTEEISGLIELQGKNQGRPYLNYLSTTLFSLDLETHCWHGSNLTREQSRHESDISLVAS